MRVLGARRRWYRARDRLMRDDELEQQGRPACAADFRSKGWEPGRPGGIDQRPLAKRPVDDNGDAALACERQYSRFDFPVDDVVRDMHEIERV